MNFSHYKKLSDKQLRIIRLQAIQVKSESLPSGITYNEAVEIIEVVGKELWLRNG